MVVQQARLSRSSKHDANSTARRTPSELPPDEKDLTGDIDNDVLESLEQLVSGDGEFVSKLEALKEVTPIASLLLKEMFSATNIEYQGNSDDFINSIMAQFQSGNANARQHAMHLLVGSLKLSEDNRSKILGGEIADVSLMCLVLDEIVKKCLNIILKRGSTKNSDPHDNNLVFSLTDALILLTGFYEFSSDDLVKLPPQSPPYKKVSNQSQEDSQCDSTTFDLSTIFSEPSECIDIPANFISKGALLHMLLDGFLILSGLKSAAKWIIASDAVPALVNNMKLHLKSIVVKTAVDSEPKQVADSHKVELTVISVTLDILINLTGHYEESLSKIIVEGSFLSAFSSATTSAMLAAVLMLRPRARKINGKLSTSRIRPVEPSVFEKMYSLLHQFSCGSFEISAALGNQTSFLQYTALYIKNDISNLESLIPQMRDAFQSMNSLNSTGDSEQQQILISTCVNEDRMPFDEVYLSEGAGVDFRRATNTASNNARRLSHSSQVLAILADGSGGAVPLPPPCSPDRDRLQRRPSFESASGGGGLRRRASSRVGDSGANQLPVMQTIESYVAELLCIKLALLVNISRLTAGKALIFKMEMVIFSISDLISKHVEFLDAKLLCACFYLLDSLVPIIYRRTPNPVSSDPEIEKQQKQLLVDEKAYADRFVSSVFVACANTISHGRDLLNVKQVRKLKFENLKYASRPPFCAPICFT